jgi:hypothetical protein
VHGFHPLAHCIEGIGEHLESMPVLGGVLHSLVPALLNALVGIVLGALGLHRQVRGPRPVSQRAGVSGVEAVPRGLAAEVQPCARSASLLECGASGNLAVLALEDWTHMSTAPIFHHAPNILKRLPSLGLDPLLPRARAEQIVELADQFPALTQTVSFECRLEEGKDQVDFALSLLPYINISALMQRLRHRFDADAAWGRVGDFLQEWSGAGALTWQVPFVCVAFDLPVDRRTLPVPCLSLCIDPNFFIKRLQLPPLAALSVDELDGVVQSCHRRLTGLELTARARDLFRIILTADDTVEPRHVSFMLSRAGAPAKLDLQLRADRLSSFLARVGRAEQAQTVDVLLRELVPDAELIQLNMLLDHRDSTCLEVEVFTDVRSRPEQRLFFLEKLVAARLAMPAKARVLRDATVQPLITEELGQTFAKSWYIKLRCGQEAVVDAKAYLAVMPRFFGSDSVGAAVPSP